MPFFNNFIKMRKIISAYYIFKKKKICTYKIPPEYQKAEADITSIFEDIEKSAKKWVKSPTEADIMTVISCWIFLIILPVFCLVISFLGYARIGVWLLSLSLFLKSVVVYFILWPAYLAGDRLEKMVGKKLEKINEQLVKHSLYLEVKNRFLNVYDVTKLEEPNKQEEEHSSVDEEIGIFYENELDASLSSEESE